MLAALLIPAVLPGALSLSTDIYPSKEFKEIVPCGTPRTLRVFEILFTSIVHPAMFPALAVIDPVAASSVTEFDPLATLSPSEFNANPFPVRLPFKLIVPL